MWGDSCRKEKAPSRCDSGLSGPQEGGLRRVYGPGSLERRVETTMNKGGSENRAMSCPQSCPHAVCATRGRVRAGSIFAQNFAPVEGATGSSSLYPHPSKLAHAQKALTERSAAGARWTFDPPSRRRGCPRRISRLCTKRVPTGQCGGQARDSHPPPGAPPSPPMRRAATGGRARSEQPLPSTRQEDPCSWHRA